MDKNIFREFERFCIEYDIGIDEEDYSFKNKEHLICWNDGLGSWPLDGIFNNNGKHPNKLYYFNLEAKINELVKWLSCRSLSLWNNDMKRLVIAKRARAVILQINSTESLASLDLLATYLIRHLPGIPNNFSFENDNSELQQTVLLHIIYLIEISACYRGFLSIGYADRCLDIIKEVFSSPNEDRIKGAGKTPYEQVALYNKAQGYLHARFHERALEEFGKILQVKNENDINYFNTKEDCKWWQWEIGRDDSLFDNYVTIPAILMKADTLINMQRSLEADECLKFFKEKSSRHILFSSKEVSEILHNRSTNSDNYKQVRLDILKNRNYNDRKKITKDLRKNDWDKSKSQITALTRKLDQENRTGLKSQQYSVLIERWQQVCEYFCNDVRKLISNGAQEQKAIENYEEAIKSLGYCALLIKRQLYNAKNNKSEMDETLLDWSKGLEQCTEIIKILHLFLSKDINLSNSSISNYMRSVFRYFNLKYKKGFIRVNAYHCSTSHEYRAHQEELREVIIDKSKELYNSFTDLSQYIYGKKEYITNIFDNIINILKDFCLILINGILENPEQQKIRVSMFEEQKLKEWKLTLLKNDTANYRNRDIRQLVATEFFGCCYLEDSCNGQCSTECPILIEKVKRNKACFNKNEGLQHMKHYYDQIVENNRNKLDQRLYFRNNKWKTESGWGFVVLKKWNSYTPALEASEGGGYFLYHNKTSKNNKNENIDLGIVIDPGYDYLKNFFEQGFSISDINAIIISHDHPDHIDDFSKIVNLLFELKKNRSNKLKTQFNPVLLGLSPGAYKRVKSLIETVKDVFEDTRILRLEDDILQVQASNNENLNVFIKPTKSFHKDSVGDSVGFLLRIKDGEKKDAIIGLPCDTKWSNNIAEQYKECDFLCIHIGGVFPEKFCMVDYLDDKKTNRKVVFEKQQLYLPGTLWFGQDIIKNSTSKDIKLLILSEFGEEMSGGLRMDFARKLANHYKAESSNDKKIAIVAGDVGLVVDPIEKCIRCSCCKEYYPWEYFDDCHAYGDTEQIYYTCPTCNNILSYDQQCRRFNEKPYGTLTDG